MTIQELKNKYRKYGFWYLRADDPNGERCKYPRYIFPGKDFDENSADVVAYVVREEHALGGFVGRTVTCYIDPETI